MAKTKKEKKVEVTPEETTNETVKVKSKSEPKYVLEVRVNDFVSSVKANSLLEALKEIIGQSDFPFGAKTKLFLSYNKGGITRHRLFHTSKARRLLMTISHKPTALEVLAESLNRDLNE